MAAEQFSVTAADINGLIGENRGVLVDTLGNLQASSLQLRATADAIGPTFQSGELVRNLEVLVGNASAASADLQAVTASLNTPANLVLIQQTLESARDALSSAQKVMADVDEITGDPAVRNQLRELINGLGALVSSTQTLERESEVARVLAPLGVQANRSTNAQRDNQAATHQNPQLVFDGERYILRPSDQLAEQGLNERGLAEQKLEAGMGIGFKNAPNKRAERFCASCYQGTESFRRRLALSQSCQLLREH